ncbi:FtsH protease activity modulator HflK [Parvularcula sp. LCG005]|uniref:FtsH protease activity modulator HflK n=1 Tax=Parvularcula sp. LCG005 TaxID=3078805 RepID=UPI0029432F02|nr:FtsH protease activity modulator HflK [Parvularcula sp. LCG005]WOI52280.1 FtsH protease activity modulator HflK [Parvularcula sp. LCG005]
MPWTDRPGGSGNNGGQGPWGQPGGGPNDNRNNGGRRPGDRNSPDLEELLKSGRDRFRRGGNGGAGGGGASEFKMPSGPILGLIGIVVVVLYLASGIYQVSPGARGIVTTFGAYSSLTGPGLKWHAPWPIQDVVVVPVDQDQTVTIGRGAGGKTSMLTSDLNIVDVEMTVNYKVKNDAVIQDGELPNAAKFVFNVEGPENLVRSATESALRQVVGESEFGPIISANRSSVNEKTEEILQEILDSYDSGIEIIRVNFGQADPPPKVIPAQSDVIDARSEAERVVNESTQYANSIVPRARGEARQTELTAQGYGQRVVREARGAASRFKDVYEQYLQAPEVTRRRMYLESMEEVLNKMNKVFIDENTSGAVPYLNLNEINRANRTDNTAGGQ